MKRVLIWDIPVRLLHWTLAVSVSAALALGLGLGADHPLFGYHAWFGMLALGALVLRVAWGFVGSAHARFRAWNWSTAALARFACALFGRGAAARPPGHNPAASWVMLAILALVGALAGTGLAGGDEPHEALASGLFVFVGAHLAGLLWHGFRHRENIAIAMFDGRKEAAESDALPHASRKAGVVTALLLAAWIAVLVRGYDRAEGTLKLPFLRHPLVLTDGAGEEE